MPSGNNLYLETPGSGSPQAGVPGSTGYGTIQQGFLETSERQFGGRDHLADYPPSAPMK